MPSFATDGLNSHATITATLRTKPTDKLLRLPTVRVPMGLLDGELDRPLLVRVTDTGASSFLNRDGYSSVVRHTHFPTFP